MNSFDPLSASQKVRQREHERLVQTSHEPCICAPYFVCPSCIARRILEEITEFQNLEEKVDIIVNGEQ